MLDEQYIRSYMNTTNKIGSDLFGDTATYMVGNLKQVTGTPFPYGALSIVYAVSNYGKTYQTIELISRAVVQSGEYEKVSLMYLSDDGSMSHHLVSFCNNRMFFPVDYESVNSGSDGVKDVYALVHQWTTMAKDRGMKSVIVLDSLASFIGETDINSSLISEVMKRINNAAKVSGAAIIVIDHATEIRDRGKVVGSKIEGNKSGKIKYAAVVCEYVPLDFMKPKLGGNFVVDKSRIVDTVPKGMEFEVIAKKGRTGDNAVDRLLTLKTFTRNFSDNGKISRSKFNAATKNSRDQWIRDFVDELFDIKVINGKEFLFRKREDKL